MLPLASTATLFPESPLELPKRLAHLICPAQLKRAIQQSVTPGLAAVSLPVPKSMLPKKYPVATKSPFDMTAIEFTAPASSALPWMLQKCAGAVSYTHLTLPTSDLV